MKDGGCHIANTKCLIFLETQIYTLLWIEEVCVYIGARFFHSMCRFETLERNALLIWGVHAPFIQISYLKMKKNLDTKFSPKSRYCMRA
jgi:hypothetical protein